MQCLNFVLFTSVMISSFFIKISTADSPSQKQCNDASPECLKTSLQAALPAFIRGLPEYGISSLDPFIINKLELSLPGGLKMEFKQGSSKGLRKCIVDSARLVEDNMEVQFQCSLIIKGKYKSSGRLLMFSIDGDGDSTIMCKNIKIRFVLKLRSTKADDGRRYMEIKNVKTRHSYDGQVVYRMTNLIKGSPRLSNIVLEFMNRNWRMVAEEFGDPIVDFGVRSVLNNVKILLKSVPLDQLINIPFNY